MDNAAAQETQILVALQAAPLDRVRLMKVLFLVWYRSGCPEDGPFTFDPYLYGPCAFDLYEALGRITARGLIVQAPQPLTRWAAYHLTEAGRQSAASCSIADHQRAAISELAPWAAAQSFRSLLDAVYREAPEFAVSSVFRSPEATS